jgi:hypothetical protein
MLWHRGSIKWNDPGCSGWCLLAKAVTASNLKLELWGRVGVQGFVVSGAPSRTSRLELPVF